MINRASNTKVVASQDKAASKAVAGRSRVSRASSQDKAGSKAAADSKSPANRIAKA
jgi:hypothetical protein